MKELQRGFSLIEIMVVVVILGILAALVVPKIMNRPDEARKVKARQDVRAIHSGLDLYKLDNGFYIFFYLHLSVTLDREDSILFFQ